LDDNEQEKFKNDVVITGNLPIEAANVGSVVSFLKKSCDTTIQPTSITNFSLSKTKNGLNMLKVTISNSSERVELF